MRVAYFDLGYSREQYGLMPTRYGGGGVAARYLKEDPEIDFWVFAPAEAFENVGRGERHDRCFVLSQETCGALRRGHPVSEIFQFSTMPDIILHPHTCESLNKGTLDVPVVHFCGFDGKAGNPRNDYILLYDDSFTPCFGEKPKYVRIGKPVPEMFVPHPKAEYIFQCTRHDDHLNTLEVARACRRFGIKGYFAGPIHNGYPLMDEIDNITTHYLGEIDEATKLAYCRHAKLFTLPLQWDAPFSQSVIEAQGEGTMLWAYRRGPFLKKYLVSGLNGFDAGEVSLLEAFNATSDISVKPCWEAAHQYDVSVMKESFKQAFKEIIYEWSQR